MNAQHTSTPWIDDECISMGGFVTIRRADGSPNGDTEEQPIATVYGQEDAAFIVRACNSFEALVEALRDIEKDIKAITDRASCAPHDDPDEASKQFTIIMQRAQFAHLKIISALAQAGEGA